uniref:Uncharacterized protein n=1 Tax=Avena sativa TaxID=4498 RepID=A0ACD5X2F8_AVESA
MPFSLVEYKPFREFTAALNPWFENVSRTTIRNECITAFNEHGNILKEFFENCDSRISLTGDMWTSNQKLSYFCMTCHFISNEWVLHKRIIRFSMLETPHNSWNMFNIVLNSIQEWNLEDKLFSFTLDNASVNTAMINLLRENLKNKGFLLIEGKLFHFCCSPHVFNMVAQDGLREIKPVVNNVRESVKFVRSSQARVEKFLEIVVQEGLSSRYKSPSVDVMTRWNSTYLMLGAALPLRNAFSSLEKQDKDFTFSPSPSEWKMAAAVCNLLECFYTATVCLSGSKYPTSHLYFYQLWNIKMMLNKEESSLNRKILNKVASSQYITIARMVNQMQIKFNQYWKETYMSACIPVVLDPRFKYDLLEYLLSDFGNEEEAGKWMGEVKNTMEELFNEYSKEESVQPQRENDTEGVEDDDDPLAQWDRYMRSKRRQSSNELDRYLKEELTPRKEEVDILQWWKISSSKYPVLSKMARDILAIPASTVPSESAFSTGGRVISDYRSSLACSTIEALICLQDWFRAADDLDRE